MKSFICIVAVFVAAASAVPQFPPKETSFKAGSTEFDCKPVPPPSPFYAYYHLRAGQTKCSEVLPGGTGLDVIIVGKPDFKTECKPGNDFRFCYVNDAKIKFLAKEQGVPETDLHQIKFDKDQFEESDFFAYCYTC